MNLDSLIISLAKGCPNIIDTNLDDFQGYTQAYNTGY
jgi:hypothetical protein